MGVATHDALMRAALLVSIAIAAFAVPRRSDAATIRVPADAATIQQAISAAVAGDTVLVSPGTYFENINFLGKAITVTSEQGPDLTIIDGHGAGSVVAFKSRETRAAVLSGFTIRGGYSSSVGGGIAIFSSSPTILNNIITDNSTCGGGSGIYSAFGSPLILHNVVKHNGVSGCTGGWGLGVFIGGDSAAELIENLITENNDDGGGATTAGGLALFAAGRALVRGNVISHNVVSTGVWCGWGGGIAIANFLQGTIVDNLIVGNQACGAGGVQWDGSLGSTVFVNNTIADNEALLMLGPALYIAGVDARNTIANNIITTRSGPALFCQNAQGVSMPVMKANVVFSADPATASYGGTCPDQTGVDGNLSADLQFVNAAAGDYRVRMSSPAVDGGDNTAPAIPATDVSGSPRIVDGNGDGTAIVDIGALEYHNHAPAADAGADQLADVESDCLARVTLTGTGADADGDALTYKWSGDFGVASGPTLNLSLPVGTHVITLTADDGNGGSASDNVTVTVRDATAPTITSVKATPDVVPANNHHMAPVVVSVTVADCDVRTTCRIESVASNEPVDGLGDGDTSPDWEITGDLTLNLRAERSGQGDGRVYTITVACVDSSGNRSTSMVLVSVPR